MYLCPYMPHRPSNPYFGGLRQSSADSFGLKLGRASGLSSHTGCIGPCRSSQYSVKAKLHGIIGEIPENYYVVTCPDGRKPQHRCSPQTKPMIFGA